MRFAAWLNLGLAVYISYGCLNSRMTGRATAVRPVEHDRETAASGARLALAGIMLLFFTHAVDIWLGGGTVDVAGRTPGMAGVLDPAAWLRPSAFMVLPLVVYAVYLGPLLARRVIGARGAPAGTIEAAPRAGRRVASTLALIVLIEVVSIVYLLLVVL
jgi:hypothetical protein